MRSITVRLLYHDVTGRLTVEIDGKRTETANNAAAMRLIREAMDRVAKAGSIDAQAEGSSGPVLTGLS